MNYSEPTRLAILACPGGEKFADEVIVHLKRLYARRFERKAVFLAKRYGMTKDDVVKQINFFNDMSTAQMGLPGPVERFRMPAFKVPARFTSFPNGELKTEVLESIRGKDIYIFQDVENHQPVSFNDGKNTKALSVNDHLMSLFVTVDAAKQAGAERVTLVIPVYPYSRQHKKKGREGLTASRTGKMLESMGVDRIITLDIHSREIENAFNFMRMENLHASYQIIRKLAKITDLESPDFTVVSPDTGAVDRNKFYATSLKKPLALLYKERDYSRVTQNALDNNIAEVKLLGKVQGKTVFMADDMLGTGGTLLKAMKFLKEQGAKEVICAISLPFFSGEAIEHFEEAYRQGWFLRIIGTNAVYHEDLLKREWYVSVNVSGLFAQTISRLHHGKSLSDVLDNRAVIEKLIMKKTTTPEQAPEDDGSART